MLKCFFTSKISRTFIFELTYILKRKNKKEYLKMKDLSIENLDISKESNKIAMHSFFGAFSIFIISFIDGLFLSIKSEFDFSTAIVSAPLVFIILSLFIGASNGLVVYISKNQKDNIQKLKLSNGITIVSILTATIIVILCYLNLNSLIDLLNIKEEMKEASYKYIFWHYIGLPFCIYISFSGSKFKGLGNAKILSKLMTFSALLNIVLDPFFIFYLNLGSEGAAIATFLSWTIVAIVHFLKNSKNKNDTFDYDFSSLITYSKLLPNFVVSQLLNVFLGFITIFFINQYTLIEISAYGFTFRLEKLVTIIAFSYSSAMIMIGGQNVTDLNRCVDIFKTTLKNSLFANTIYITILLFLVKPFAEICGFSTESAILVKDFVIYLSIGYIINTISQVYSGYLYVFSKHNYVLFCNILKICLFLPLFVYLGNNLFGYNGIMYGITLTSIVSFILLISMTYKDFFNLIKKG